MFQMIIGLLALLAVIFIRDDRPIWRTPRQTSRRPDPFWVMLIEDMEEDLENGD